MEEPVLASGRRGSIHRPKRRAEAGPIPVERKRCVQAADRRRGPTDNKSWEFAGNVTRKFGKLSLRVAAIYSPDDLGGAERSLFVEGGPTYEISKTTRISGAIGRRDRVNGDDYTAFNAGVAHTLFKGMTLDARYYGTNRSDLGEFLEDRLVVSARMSF
jgi:hypothetical protein